MPEPWVDLSRRLHLRKGTKGPIYIFFILAAAVSSHAGVLQSNVGGTDPNSTAFFAESFTTPTGGPFDDLFVAFFADSAGNTPFASGTIFLLSSLYTGTPNALTTSTPGFIAASTGVVGNEWMFAPSVTLASSTQYFFYTTSSIPTLTFLGGNGTAETAYFAPTGTSNFTSTTTTANYEVLGDVAGSGSVPEPGTFLLLGVGASLLLIGLLRRRLI